MYTYKPAGMGIQTTFKYQSAAVTLGFSRIHTGMPSVMLRRRRRKFTTSIQPAKAYEDESVMLSGPH